MRKILNDIKRANSDMPKSTKVIYSLLALAVLYILISKLINTIEIFSNSTCVNYFDSFT